MKKIAIIGANAFQNPLIVKAKEMGLETHVFAWKDGSIGEKTADVFHPISIVEMDKILKECKAINPVAVVSIGTDLGNITVQYVAEHLGLVCNSLDCIKKTTDKYEMRTALKKKGIRTPQFCKIREEEQLEQVKSYNFPVITKPTDRSGSRGINKVETFSDLKNAFLVSQRESFSKEVIIEEYIAGDEYSCEAISFEGKHRLLAVTKKYTTGAPHFIETGHLEPAPFSDSVYLKIEEQIIGILDALGVKYGASHTEAKIDSKGNLNIIEVGSRMGGDCIGSDLVRISTGYDFVKMVIQASMGIKPVFEKCVEPQYAGIKFIFSKEEYEHFLELKAKKPEHIFSFHIEDVDMNEKITDSSTRYGYYILACNKEKDILRELEKYPQLVKH